MKYTQGMSLVEILLAIAISSFFVLSVSVFVVSLHPHSLMKSILGGEKEKVWIHPKLWNQVDKFTNSTHTYIVDESISGQKTCDDVYDFDLTYFTSAQLGISPTSIPTGIRIVGDTLFMSLNSSSTTDPDLVVYRISQEGLSIISSLNTGPGIADMVISGLMVFAANTSVNSQAQMIDVSDELNPILVRNFVIPGSNSMTSPISKKIFAYKNILFVGTEKSSLPELYAFDIKTGTPQLSVDTEYGINGLYVRDDKLYVLSPKDPELDIFDINSMAKIDSFDAPQSLGNGRSISMSGDSVFLGRSKGNDELYDVTRMISKHIGASVDYVVSTLKTIFIFTSSSQGRIQSLNVKDLSLISNLSINDRVSSVACVPNGFYISLQSTSTPIVKLIKHI